MPPHDDLPREVVFAWARSQLRPSPIHPPFTPEDDIGYCHTCEVRRTRAEAAQRMVDECCCYVCVVCGSKLDESPF